MIVILKTVHKKRKNSNKGGKSSNKKVGSNTSVNVKSAIFAKEAITPIPTERKGVSTTVLSGYSEADFTKTDFVEASAENYRSAYERDSKLYLSAQSLIRDVLTKYEIVERKLKGDTPVDSGKKLEVEKWIEDIELIFSSTSTSALEEFLEDYMISGFAVQQLIVEGNEIVGLHRLDPAKTQIYKNPYSRTRVVFHDRAITGQAEWMAFGDLEDPMLEEFKKLPEIKSKNIPESAWIDINSIILIEGSSFVKRCLNSVYHRQIIINKLSKQMNLRSVVPAVHLAVGIISGSEVFGMPADKNTVKPDEFRQALADYATAYSQIMNDGVLATSGIVKITPIDKNIDTPYLEYMMNKYEEEIFNAFFSSEGLWKSGIADYRRKDLRKERKNVIRSIQEKIEQLIYKLIKMNFGDQIPIYLEFISEDMEEMSEKADYYNKTAEMAINLRNAGVTVEAINGILAQLGVSVELDETAPVGKSVDLNGDGNGLQAQQMAEEDEDKNIPAKILTEAFVASVMKEYEEATFAMTDDIYEYIQKNQGKNRTKASFKALTKMVDSGYAKIDLRDNVDEMFDKAAKLTGLAVKTDSGAIGFAKEYTYDLIKDIDSTQKKNLKNLIVQELNGKSGKKDLATQIAETCNRTRVSANAIARTEISRAVNESQIEYYRQYDKQNKTRTIAVYHCMKSTACAECLALDGKEFSLEEASGLLPKHVNCNCYFTFKVVEVF